MNFPLIKNASRGSKLLTFTLLLIFGLVFSSIFGLLIIKMRGGTMTDITNLQINQICSQIIGLLLPPLAYAMLVQENPFNYLGFKNLPKWALLGIVAMFTVLPFNAWIAEWNNSIVFPESMAALESKLKNLHELYESTSEMLMKGSNLVVGILIFGLLAAVSEELLFRSVIQKALVKIFKNVHIGIFVAAIIFSAFHGDFYGFFPRFILGLMLGYMFWLSGSIWATIIMHFTNNITVVMLFFMNKKEIIHVDVDKVGNTDNALLIIISLIATVAIFLACYRFKNKTAQLTN